MIAQVRSRNFTKRLAARTQPTTDNPAGFVTRIRGVVRSTKRLQQERKDGSHRDMRNRAGDGTASSTELIRGGPFSVSAQETREPPRFRVGVDAVRLDAVVTDRDGRIVADLTADDFEVRQDGKLQKVTFAEFMPVLAGPAPADVSPAHSNPEVLVGSPSTAVRREDVQRTVAVVVDDLGLSVESLLNTQRALHAFVDRELRPSDLVALVRTGGAGGGVQPFTTDRRVLHAAIEGLRWNGASRNGLEAFEPVNSWSTLPPGNYVMQISATTSDARRQGRSRVAVQRIGFDVR